MNQTYNLVRGTGEALDFFLFKQIITFLLSDWVCMSQILEAVSIDYRLDGSMKSSEYLNLGQV